MNRLSPSMRTPSVSRLTRYVGRSGAGDCCCAPNAATMTYKVTKENAGISTSGTLSSNLPADNVFLGPISWNAARTTGGTGPVYDVVHVYRYTYTAS